MIDRFHCHVGDTARSYPVTLEDAVETPINLTDCTVTFSMKHKQTGVLKVDRAACTIVSASLGRVSWKPVDADVDTAGTYLAWFTVTNADTEPFTVPSAAHPNEFNQIVIADTITPIP